MTPPLTDRMDGSCGGGGTRPGLRTAAAVKVAHRMSQFSSLYRHGFARVAAAVPHLRIAEPEFNAARTLDLARSASEEHAALVVFPELGLSGYSIDDLFHQQAILDGVLDGLATIREASADL